MFAQGEEPGPTQHEKILVAQGNNTWDSETISRHVRELEALAREGGAARIMAKLREVVPEYRPEASPAEAFRRTFVGNGEADSNR